MVRCYGGPFDPIGVDDARARFGMENMARGGVGPSLATGADRGERSDDGGTSDGRSMSVDDFGPKSPNGSEGSQRWPEFRKNLHSV